MSSHCDKIRKALEAEIYSRADFLAKNCCKDMEEYRLQTGQIKGLTAALKIVETIFKSGADEDDHGTPIPS